MQQQVVGAALFAVAIVDTAIGHLVVAPRVADPQKRKLLRAAFSVSGLIIAGVALAIFQGSVRLD